MRKKKSWYISRKYQENLMQDFREIIKRKGLVLSNYVKDIADKTERSVSGVQSQIYLNNKLTEDVKIRIEEIIETIKTLRRTHEN